MRRQFLNCTRSPRRCFAPAAALAQSAAGLDHGSARVERGATGRPLSAASNAGAGRNRREPLARTRTLSRRAGDARRQAKPARCQRRDARALRAAGRRPHGARCVREGNGQRARRVDPRDRQPGAAVGAARRTDRRIGRHAGGAGAVASGPQRRPAAWPPRAATRPIPRRRVLPRPTRGHRGRDSDGRRFAGARLAGARPGRGATTCCITRWSAATARVLDVELRTAIRHATTFSRSTRARARNGRCRPRRRQRAVARSAGLHGAQTTLIIGGNNVDGLPRRNDDNAVRRRRTPSPAATS